MIRNFLFWILYRLGIISGIHWTNRKSDRFPVLVFHRISPHNDPFWPPLTPQTFEKIIVLLKRHYNILALENLFDYTDADLRNSCFITLDDAFEDNYTWARPILLKHNLPASFFVPTRCVSSGEVVWQIQLRNSLKHTTCNLLEVDIAEKHYSFALSTEKEKIKAFGVLLHQLSLLNEKGFLETLHLLFQRLGEFKDEQIQIMTLQQVQSLSKNFGIHSHTMHHYYLSNLAPERVKEEFQGSIEELNSWVPLRKVDFLAYPVGNYTNETAQQAGNYFRSSFQVGEELVRISSLKNHLYCMSIPRFNIHNSSPYEVYARINGMHSFFKRTAKIFGL